MFPSKSSGFFLMFAGRVFETPALQDQGYKGIVGCGMFCKDKLKPQSHRNSRLDRFKRVKLTTKQTR